MSPPRRLTFAVGTTLLTASLSLGAAGCDDERTVNPAPKKKPADDGADGAKVPEETVNVGPEEDGGGPGPEQEEEVHVNEGPEPEPAPEPEDTVNPGPEPGPETAPKHVNVRPDSKN